jgi:hypothetical protein
MRSVACSIAACLLATTLPAETKTAVIVDSGSTNTAGFKIVVEKSGKAVYTESARTAAIHRKISADLVRRLFADLEAGKPLADLPHRPCMKSASFGTTMTIEFSGQTTPDLSCRSGADAKLQALIDDADQIVKVFKTP